MNSLLEKTCISTLVLVLGLVPAGAAQEEDFSQVLRELNIMRNILEATLEEESKSNNFAFVSTPPSAVYLAGQGMVFTFHVNRFSYRGGDFSGFGSYWHDFSVNMAQMAADVAAEVQAAFPGIDLNLDIDPVPPAAPPVPTRRGREGDAFAEHRAAMEEMAEALRDRREDIQDLQRDLRGLQRDLRRGAEDPEVLEERLAAVNEELEREMAALEEQREAYEQFTNEYRRLQEEHLAEFGNRLVNLVATTLCDYGSTLKELGNNEHVTLIFRNLEQGQDQVYRDAFTEVRAPANSGRDRIYVFDYPDVTSCESPETLLQNAINYGI